MYVLVPDDMSFLVRFNEIENPLLSHLRDYTLMELYLDQAELIRNAHKAWREIHRGLPAVLKWERLPEDGAPPQAGGYLLHSPHGKQLTSLYAVEVSPGHLHTLRECYTMLAGAEQAGYGPLANAVFAVQRASGNETKRLLDGYRRVVEVLELKAPYTLAASLRRATPSGPEAPSVGITLNGEEYGSYQQLCTDLVAVLSEGDRFAYLQHGRMYA
ncbi:hypothetical protein M2164_000150 [Streptomyces sp. SAI-208]|uniref:hypothetical protein n=1 Tax=Streptomyces sp. SAI-208 TaxID=2940550 RepID=UPI002474217B|nr:hypothetical protein [Streptomyces sp. SAI-208]MDH6604515.1 hypothetical protein [Streptomyces sp. SAI-208]